VTPESFPLLLREQIQALIDQWRRRAGVIERNAKGTVVEDMLCNRVLTFQECANELAALLSRIGEAPPADDVNWKHRFDQLADAVAPFRHTAEDRCLWEAEDGDVSVPALVSAAVNHREATPASWANPQSEDSDVVTRLTAIVREADQEFQRVGGSSRDWVRDCFLPLLNQAGYGIAVTPVAPPEAPGAAEDRIAAIRAREQAAAPVEATLKLETNSHQTHDPHDPQRRSGEPLCHDREADADGARRCGSIAGASRVRVGHDTGECVKSRSGEDDDSVDTRVQPGAPPRHSGQASSTQGVNPRPPEAHGAAEDRSAVIRRNAEEWLAGLHPGYVQNSRGVIEDLLAALTDQEAQIRQLRDEANYYKEELAVRDRDPDVRDHMLNSAGRRQFDRAAKAEADLRQVTAQRDKWLDAFNRSEQFQNGPTKRAEKAETELQAAREEIARLRAGQEQP
jgi:hypothetical protein